MAFLICVFASRRSRREKIQEWLRYLDNLERVHGDHPDRLHTILLLRARAIGWLEGTGEPEQEQWRGVRVDAVVPPSDTVQGLSGRTRAEIPIVMAGPSV
jgi:hypothetical protein